MEKKYEKLISELKGREKIRVLFVCLGNICRSPAAEGVLKGLVAEKGVESRWEIDSAGTGGWHVGELPDERMRIHARRRGINLVHRCRKVQEADFNAFDLIVPMDANNEKNLRQLAPTLEDSRKIVPMAQFLNPSTRFDYVPDPYYEGAEGFEIVLDLLQEGCARMLEMLG